MCVLASPQDFFVAITDGIFYSRRLASYTGTNKYSLVLFLYIFVAGVVTTVLSPSFGKLYAGSAAAEAEFKELHTRLREYSESIAFYQGGKPEAGHIDVSKRRGRPGLELDSQWLNARIDDIYAMRRALKEN